MNETLSQKEFLTLLIDLSGGVNRCPHTEISQEEILSVSRTVARGTPYEGVFMTSSAFISVRHRLNNIASDE